MFSVYVCRCPDPAPHAAAGLRILLRRDGAAAAGRLRTDRRLPGGAPRHSQHRRRGHRHHAVPEAGIRVQVGGLPAQQFRDDWERGEQPKGKEGKLVMKEYKREGKEENLGDKPRGNGGKKKGKGGKNWERTKK